MDEPLRLIAEARRAYLEVNDYTCVLVKQERLRGRLQPEHVMMMKARREPFSVYLSWSAPKSVKGQEACYVAGKHEGRMRVHPAGLLGALGFVSLEPDDPRAREDSNHPITEAGVGNLIDRFARAWEEERRLNRTQARLSEWEFHGRPCTRVETIQADPAGGRIPYYRTVLCFDRATRLPVRVECYDWPRPNGNPDGDLSEVYSYLNVRLNVGLGDGDFDR
jgi:hypothetical protein